MQTIREMDVIPAMTSLPGLLTRLSQILYSGVWKDQSLWVSDWLGPMESLMDIPCSESKDHSLRWLDQIHPRDRAHYQSTLNDLMRSGGEAKLEYRLLTRSKQERFVQDYLLAEQLPDGTLRVDGLLVDQTDMIQTRKRLDRTRLLQNMGQLAAGIVHEINTPIQFIGDNLQFLGESFEQILDLMKRYQQVAEGAAPESAGPRIPDSLVEATDPSDFDFLQQEIPQAIRQSVDGIRHVTAIVTAMRDFSHIDERRMAPSDVNKAVKSTLIIVHHQLKYVAEVQTDLDPDLPMVMCCIDDLNQVFINLLINAAHAVGDVVGDHGTQKGTICVTTRRDDASIVITISDTGAGIPEEVQKRMFEPFFTTKGHDKGTGQGLLYVKTIVVDKHHGTLTWDSKPGQGTTFSVRIPVEQKPRKTDEPVQTNPVC
jgi:two-component system, NtrC family, sensor kinase